MGRLKKKKKKEIYLKTLELLKVPNVFNSKNFLQELYHHMHSIFSDINARCFTFKKARTAVRNFNLDKGIKDKDIYL